MKNGFMNIAQAAERWGVSTRQVQNLCKRGAVTGAERFGHSWIIPLDTAKPVDGRSKAARAAKEAPKAKPLVRRSPFLDMTDLYNAPGTADQCIEALSWHLEAQQLLAAEIAYSRGEIDKVYQHAREFFESHTGLYAVISGGLLLSLVAMWKGDMQLWNESRKYLYEAPCKTEDDRDAVFLALACGDSALRNTKDFPEWFTKGRFSRLPVDSHPAARVFYVKYLMIFAQELAMGNYSFPDVTGLGFMKSIPYIAEPMVAQAEADQTLMVEIYLRLLCAVSYHQTGDMKSAADHLDKAIKLCLADKLYGPLVEHRRQLGLFLDERLMLIDPDAAKKVKELHKTLHEGWTRLHNAVTERQVKVTLTARERECARLAAFGLTDAQIATQLYLSEHTVSTFIDRARNKTGVIDRKDFGIFV